MEIRQETHQTEQPAQQETTHPGHAVGGNHARWTVEFGQRRPYCPESPIANLGCDAGCG